MRRTIRRARGTLTVLGHLPGQRRALRHPREKLEARRDARVRASIREAARAVPYYRELLNRERIDPDEIRTAAHLRRLPVVDRAMLQAAPEAFRATTPAGQTAIAFRTTGSTAMPLTVYHDRSSLLANIAYSEREREVEALLAGRRYRYAAIELRAAGGTQPRVQARYAQETFRPLRPTRRPLSVDTPPDEVLEAMNRIRPAVVHSYGAYLELLFRVAAATRSLRHRPSVVAYSGDTMSAAGRDLIESEFGIPVISAYNAVECFKIGFTCELRQGFHLHEDLCDVRIVGPEGSDVPAGEKGEVVISNLVNRGTVLLNYRLGDLARLEEGRCDCGRTSRRLVDLDGRVDETIETAGGAFVYPTRVWHVFRERPEILRYQLVQHEPDRFELRVVTTEGRAADRAATGAAEELRLVLGGSTVELSRHDDLPAGPGGKFRHLVPLGARDARVESGSAIG